MTAEQRFFLSLLNDHVRGGSTALVPAGLDWDVVYEYAQSQSLLGLCYVQLKSIAKAASSVPEDVLERFHRGFFNDVYVAVNHRAFMNAVSARFQEAGVRFCPFKGWLVKECWPVAELRTMGDIDLLIHTEDREKTDSIMRDLGFDRLIDNHAVWTYFAKDIVFELHDHMFYEHLTSEVDYRGYFDRAWDYVDEDLDPSFHFLYLITHLAKHTVNKGMGFRAYLDLLFFCRAYGAQMRWDWILEQLDLLKLRRFAETCFAFCLRWFSFEPPFPVRELDDDFYAFVSGKMFQDGTFGLENTQNVAASSAKELTHSRASYWFGAASLTLRRLFPSYSDMQLIPWYRFVDGRPWLLPAAWIYRWYYCLVHKRKQGTELLIEPYAKKEAIEKRQKLINDWGL